MVYCGEIKTHKVTTQVFTDSFKIWSSQKPFYAPHKRDAGYNGNDRVQLDQNWIVIITRRVLTDL
jgi:hypothetical protein